MSIPLDHQRIIATNLLRAALNSLKKVECAELDRSDQATAAVALQNLCNIERSLNGSKPLSDDAAAARLSAVATSLMGCSDPHLKNVASAHVVKAARIFNELSLHQLPPFR